MHAPLAKYSMMRRLMSSAGWWLAGSQVDLDFQTPRYRDASVAANVGPYDLLSCSRASVGYAQTAAGVLVPFAANELRITNQGLLVEDARTNLREASQTFGDTTYWTTSAASITSDAATAPDGTVTADKLVDDISNGQHIVYKNVTTTAARYAWSAYFKAAERTFASLTACSTGSDRYGVVINLSNGAITDTKIEGSPTNYSSSSEALANGWYRLIILMDGSASTSFMLLGLSNSGTPTWESGGGGTPVYIGDGSSGAYVWGAQLELGAFASSYIPTTTAAAARAADVVTAIGNLDAVFSALPQSVVLDYQLIGPPGSGVFPVFIGPTGAGSTPALYNGGTGVRITYDPNGSGGAISRDRGTALTASPFKVGYSQDSTPAESLVIDGGTVVNGAAAAALTDATLGSNAGINYSYGYFRRLTLWTSRLADATLQGFTAP